VLNHDQLSAALAVAKQRFALLRKKYPQLKADLVWSLPGGQAGIDSSPVQILNEFSSMVVDDAAKANALRLLDQLEAQAGSETGWQKEQLKLLVAKLQYHAHCQVELRFSELNYALIWQLQVDALVDRQLTPQTKASILIVLGTLAHFANTRHES
jgi:hypothetical protein